MLLEGVDGSTLHPPKSALVLDWRSEAAILLAVAGMRVGGRGQALLYVVRAKVWSRGDFSRGGSGL